MPKQDDPLVSVILPTYNRAHVLGRAINSVLDQTYLDFELIVVDDGSNDNTEEVVSSFDDPRIRFLRHEKNRGVSAARNTGIRAARGEYIAFQDSDDEWFPEKLERQMEIFNQDKTGRIGLVTCGLSSTTASESGLRRPMPPLNFERLLMRYRGDGISTQRLLAKRKLAAPELYFDESLPACEDWDFALRLSRIVNIEAVSEPLVRRYREKGQHVFDSPNGIKASLMLIEKYKAELQARPKMLARHHERIAFKYYRNKDAQSARMHFKAAFAAFPGRPLTFFYFFSAFFGPSGLRLILKLQRISANTWKNPIKKLHCLLIDSSLQQDMPISKLRFSTQKTYTADGYGGKDVTTWPVYRFFLAYLNGDHEGARAAFCSWYLAELNKYHAIPKKEGGMHGGSLYKLIVEQYIEKGIAYRGDIFTDPEVVNKAIRKRVDQRLALLTSIQQKGYDVTSDNPVKGVKKNGYVYITNGHHRWAALKALGYHNIPKILVISPILPSWGNSKQNIENMIV